jgi:DNA-binding CsgD family transcriptional regulator
VPVEDEFGRTLVDNAEVALALDRVYDAALLVDDWPQALDGLARTLGAAGAIVVPRKPENQALGFPTSRTAAEVITSYIAEGWYRSDIRGQRAWPRFASGASVVIEQQLTTEEERRSSPYYQELFGHFGLPWCAAVGFKVEGQQWALTLLRGAGQGPYELGDVAAFDALVPHLQRIVKAATLFQAAMDARTIEVSAAKGAAAITVDRTGHVLDQTPAATTLLGRELRIVRGTLRATDDASDRALQASLHAATGPSSPGSAPGMAPVAIQRQGGRPLIVEFIPLPFVARDVFARAVAVALLTDLDARAAPSDQRVAQIFGFTPGEARLAVLIGAGDSLKSAASQLGIAEATARNVLKRIFDKTDVSRQAELVALFGKLGSG